MHLLFPRLCVVCGEPLVRGEEVMCVRCLASMPYASGGDLRVVCV